MDSTPPRTGALYLLPPEPGDETDKDDRPHAVLSHVGDNDTTITLAYCSTRATAADLGAQFIFIEPGAEGFAGTGLQKATYIYPSHLVVIEPEELQEYRRIGALSGRPLAALRGIALPRALGYGTGTCRDPGGAAGSLRGAVLQFSPSGRERVGAEYALVVTDPVFSRQHETLNVIPLVDADKVKSPAPPDLLFNGLDWIEPLSGITSVVAFVRLVQAVRVRRDVSRILPPHADALTMKRVDLALRSVFLRPEEIADADAGTPKGSVPG